MREPELLIEELKTRLRIIKMESEEALKSLQAYIDERRNTSR